MNITMRKDITCQAGSAVIRMTKDLGESDELKVKLIIGKTQKQGKWPVYLDSESGDDANLVAKIIEIKEDDGTVLDDTDIEALISEGHYRIVITGPQTNMINGKLQLLKSSAAASQSSDAELSDELKHLMDAKVQAGIVTREDINARVKFMQDNGVDTFLITRVVKGYRTYRKPAHIPGCLYVDPYLESSRRQKQEGIISEGLRAAVGRMGMICEGEKSTGKNVYLETLSWLLGMPMYLITFSRQMSPSSIYGEKTTDNSAAEALRSDLALNGAKAEIRAGRHSYSDPQAMRNDVDLAAQFELLKAQAASVNIVIDASELYDWLTDGGLMCFNEMNMCEANFFASFTNQLLDGTGFLFVPGRGEVPIHPDCVLFGTQNADYQGVEQQNEATLSRFGCIEFKQPETIKKQLQTAVMAKLKKDGFPKTSLDAKYYNACEAFYKQCRGAVRKAAVSNACLNIRGFVRALVTVAESDGYATLERQVEMHVVNTCPFDERQPLLDILKNVIAI